MAKKLPPLNSLRAFASAAKFESFTKASSELGVTQGAISKQIGILEDYLGVNLFERKHQSLVLTKAAKKYLCAVDTALDTIEEATAKIIKKTNKEILNINTMMSLSNHWLLPMLDEFKTLHPYNVNVEISKVSDGSLDFDKNDTDISIRVGKASDWKNLSSEKLIDERLICVCHPKLKSKIKSPADLLTQNLLAHTSRLHAQNSRSSNWEKFFKVIGLKNVKINHTSGFECFFMLIEAAKNGSGIILAPDFLVKKELESGHLVIACEGVLKSEYGYYLSHPKQKAHLQKIADFKKWIKNQMLLNKGII